MRIVIALASVVLLSTSIGVISSKAAEPVIYSASQKTVILQATRQEELVKQAASSKSAQISASKAKQEEIDRIATERVYSPSQDKANVKKEKMNLANAIDNTDEVSEAEVARLAALLRNNQTVNGVKLSKYLTSAVNVSSVLNRAVALHWGDASNTCVYFSSEAMRRIGVAVPRATCNTREYLAYLRAHAWVSTYNIKTLTPGSICFTTSIGGYPTHTFVFMGWVTSGNYTLAYVADNQDKSVHIRNMGATKQTEAFAFYMHTPTPPITIAATTSYGSANVSWSAVSSVSGYGIYRSTANAGPYILLSASSKLKYNNTGISAKTTYYYRIRTYRYAGSVKAYSSYSESIISKQPILPVPTSVTAVPTSNKSIDISWNKVNGATGYIVYRAAASGGSYTLISSTTNTKCSSTNLITNTEYVYLVCSYRVVGKGKVYSAYSDKISSKPIPVVAVPNEPTSGETSPS